MAGERYNHSLDIGKQLEQEEAAKPPQETPVPEAAPQPEPEPEEPVVHDPGEEDVNEIIDKDIPRLKPKKTNAERFAVFAIPLCLLFLILIASWALTRPTNLPLLDTLAEQAVEQQLTVGIARTIEAEYPMLSQQEKAKRAARAFSEAWTTDDVEQEIAQLATSLKAHYQTSEGIPYLYAPDDYFHYRRARSILQHGHEGETLTNGRPFDTLRNAPFGEFADTRDAFPAVQVTLVRIARVVSHASIERVLATAPVVFGILSLIVFFFLIRLLGGTFPALFASAALALHPRFIRMHFAGLADSGSLNMLLSLLILLLFVAATRSCGIKRLACLALAALTAAAFAQIWSGWYFPLVLIALYLFCTAAVALVSRTRAGKHGAWVLLAVITLCAVLGAAAIVWTGAFDKLLTYARLAAPDAAFYPTAFPFVSELSATPPGMLVKLAGGWLLTLFWIGGILILLKRAWQATLPGKRTPEQQHQTRTALFLLAWGIPLLIAGVLAYRFLGYAMPPFAAIAAVGAGRLARALEHVIRWFSDKPAETIAKLAGAGLVLIAILTPLAAGVRDTTILPLVNDGIAETAQRIASQSRPDAIIMTWWSLGYPWQALARRATAIDGGSLSSPRLWWVAKAFTTTAEREARDIFRFLFCRGERTVITPARNAFGAQTAHDLALNLVNSKADDISILLPNGTSVMASDVRCTPPETFAVVTEDMLQQLPTFAALTAWDFETQTMPERDASIITPLYSCASTNKTSVRCANSYVIDLAALGARRGSATPAALHVYLNGQRRTRAFDGTPSSAVLVLSSDNDGSMRAFEVHRDYADSLLVRLFANDQNLKFFEPVSTVTKPDRVVAYELAWLGRNITFTNVAPANASAAELSGLLAQSLRDED